MAGKWNYTWMYDKQGNRILRHRFVMQEYLSRKLKRSEYIHHINGNQQDDRIENLKLMTVQEHNNLHKRVKKIKQICKCCGIEFGVKPNIFRWKKKIGQKGFFCSRKCAGKFLSPPISKPKEHIEKIVIKAKKEGLSGYAIAKKYNLNGQTVYNHINRLGL